MKIKIYEIDYDNSESDCSDLPTEMIVDVPNEITDLPANERLDAIDDFASEYITEQTDMCHYGFKLEIME